MTYTLTFSHVSPIERRTVPLLDASGREVTLQINAASKSATYSHDAVIAFCAGQGNDCRIRRIANDNRR